MNIRPFIVVAMLFAAGCGQETASEQRLDVAVKNHTAMMLDKVNIRFGTHSSYPGILSANAIAVHMFFEPDIGDSAEVTWVEPGGVVRTQTVALAGVYDKKKAGRLTFEIGPTNVAVNFQDLH